MKWIFVVRQINDIIEQYNLRHFLRQLNDSFIEAFIDVRTLHIIIEAFMLLHTVLRYKYAA